MNTIKIKWTFLFLLSGILAHANHPILQQKGINFFVIGDWGNADTNQRNVANAMVNEAIKHPIDFIMSVGDNFYPHGVKSIKDPQWKNTFEDVYSDPHLKKEWYTALGNHDYSGKAKAQLKYHQVNPLWKTKERYYSFTKAIPQSKDSVIFIVIDTNPFDKSLNRFHSGLFLQNKRKQLRWLTKTLEESDAKWKIVVGHHPLYTTGTRRGKMGKIRDVFLPFFKKYHVDAYFAGHDHDLQHQKPQGFTHYFVSGGGSEHRGVTSDSTMTKFAMSSFGFMRVELFSDTLDVSIINHQNKELYRTKIGKQ